MTENEVTIDGVRYVAVPETDGCKRCAGLNTGLCTRLPECDADAREDERAVIFVKADPDAPDELTALRELNRELVDGLESALSVIRNLPGWTMYSGTIMSGEDLIAKARGEK